MGKGLRFRPPAIVLSPEQRWVLLRAFGPAERELTVRFEGGAAVERARALSLSARIGARVPRERLVKEVGANSVAGFTRDFHLAAASAVQLGQLARDVSGFAETLRLPVILLKHAAIERAGAGTIGAREVCDLDVLVPEGRAGELRDELLHRGFLEADFHPEDQHLPPLHHPSGATIEIHLAIPGVCVGRGRAWADADALLQGGLCSPARDMPAGCFVPVRDVLLGHLLVHAIEQHGLAPQSYPLLRAIGDLIDLEFTVGSLPAFMAGPYEWVRQDVSEAEVRAVAELCDRLSAGDETLWAEGGPKDDAGRVLAHVIAGTFDHGYQESLRVQAMWHGLRHGSAGASARGFGRTLFLTRQQIEIIYGKPRSELGYLGRRLARPFDLAWRLGKYGVSAIRMRLRRLSLH